MEKSRTAQAADMVLAGSTIRDASRKYDLSEAGVRMAVKRAKDKAKVAEGVCASCGAPVDGAGHHKASKRK